MDLLSGFLSFMELVLLLLSLLFVLSYTTIFRFHFFKDRPSEKKMERKKEKDIQALSGYNLKPSTI